jgi:hypothetical protein
MTHPLPRPQNKLLTQCVLIQQDTVPLPSVQRTGLERVTAMPLISTLVFSALWSRVTVILLTVPSIICLPTGIPQVTIENLKSAASLLTSHDATRLRASARSPLPGCPLALTCWDQRLGPRPTLTALHRRQCAPPQGGEGGRHVILDRRVVVARLLCSSCYLRDCPALHHL